MKQFTLTTSGQNQVIDITEKINLDLPKTFTGLVALNALHTTCAVTTADLDPGTDLDLIDAIKELVPKIRYRHPHNPDPEHVGDHLFSSFIGTSLFIPAQKGHLVLGTWQRVVFIEMDGPRKRHVTVTLIQEAQ
jgi:secondary thiamine-phosphate synthase enzyme